MNKKNTRPLDWAKEQSRWTPLVALAGFKNNKDFCEKITNEKIKITINAFRDYTCGRKRCPDNKRALIIAAIKPLRKNKNLLD